MRSRVQSGSRCSSTASQMNACMNAPAASVNLGARSVVGASHRHASSPSKSCRREDECRTPTRWPQVRTLCLAEVKRRNGPRPAVAETIDPRSPCKFATSADRPVLPEADVSDEQAARSALQRFRTFGFEVRKQFFCSAFCPLLIGQRARSAAWLGGDVSELYAHGNGTPSPVLML